MWIEQQPLRFAPLELTKKGTGYVLTSGSTELNLSEREAQYLDQLQNGSSIHKLVMNFLDHGWLVNFRELYKFIDTMISHHLILNPEVQSYFAATKAVKVTTGSDIKFEASHSVGGSPDILKTLPFFRTLTPELQAVFVKNSSIHDVGAGTRMVKTGDNHRELFVVIEGNMGVYRTYPDGRRQLISTVGPGALFGEGGFLLSRPRSADVIALTNAKVAMVRHSQEFVTMIESGMAETLQRRFWVLNGLLSSDLFSHMPSETLDSLVFAGKIIDAKENAVIMREGDPGRSFYIIVQGHIVFTQNKKVLRVLNQGGIFGEIALMVSGGVRSATAQAQSNSLLLEVEMKEFYNVLANHLFLAKSLEEIAWARWENKPAK